MALPSTGYTTATVDNPSSALSDFTLMVDLSDMPSNWWSAVDTSDGTKGRAAKDDGTELATDWIDFDDTAETGWLRVKWSGTLASTGTQTLRVYPPVSGNTSYAASDTYGSDNAYDADWVGYWPMHDVNDRTANAYHGTAQGGVTVGGATGRVGNATRFINNSGNAINLGVSPGDDLEANSNFTISAWVEPNSVVDGSIVSRWPNDGGKIDGQQFLLWLDVGGSVGYATIIRQNGAVARIGESDSNAAVNTWAHVVSTYDQTTLQTIVDGGSSGSSVSSTINLQNVSSNVLIGNDPVDGGRNFNGIIDEVQIHKVSRSDDWVKHEYDQTSNNSTFWGTWTWNAATTTTATIPPFLLEMHMTGSF